jgi:Zn-dependent peptidase ImmA (M78 family)
MFIGIKDRPVIFIDDNIPNAFKFEVLAHELAHYQLHNNKHSYCFNTAKYLADKHYRDTVEAEANAFAERLIRYVRFKLNLRGIRSGSAALKAVA